jgi:hypothetical protein
MIVGLQAHAGAFRMEYRPDGGSLEEGSHNTKAAGGHPCSETQRVSVDPRPPPLVFKGLHGSNVKAIIKP